MKNLQFECSSASDVRDLMLQNFRNCAQPGHPEVMMAQIGVPIAKGIELSLDSALLGRDFEQLAAFLGIPEEMAKSLQICAATRILAHTGLAKVGNLHPAVVERIDSAIGPAIAARAKQVQAEQPATPKADTPPTQKELEAMFDQFVEHRWEGDPVSKTSEPYLRHERAIREQLGRALTAIPKIGAGYHNWLKMHFGDTYPTPMADGSSPPIPLRSILRDWDIIMTVADLQPEAS